MHLEDDPHYRQIRAYWLWCFLTDRQCVPEVVRSLVLAAVIASAPTTACVLIGENTAAKKPSQQPNNNDQHNQCFKETAIASSAKTTGLFTTVIAPVETKIFRHNNSSLSKYPIVSYISALLRSQL